MSEPRLIERHCGGWLAVSGRDDPVQIGVEAPTREEAITLFNEHRARWEETLSTARAALKEQA